MADKNTVEISFKAVDADKLEKAIKSLDRATKSLVKGQAKLVTEGKKVKNVHEKLKNTTEKTTKSFFNLAGSQRLLSGSFAVLRSKMLLFNFAMGLGIRQVSRLVAESAKVSAMETAFNTLSGATGDSTLSMQKLEESTNGTMNQFDLFKQANNAMILGVADNSDTMAEMFDIAQRLGRALGQDTTSSVESLITGIGRQSRLMLDNIGIIVKSEEAYDNYAEKLNTTADKLTDSQKKQAFLEATMESARAKVATLGEENLTARDKMDQLSTASSNLATTIGKQLSPSFGNLSSSTAKVINNLTKLIKLATDENSLEIKHYKTIEKTNEFLKENAKQYGFVTNESNSLISRLVTLRQKFIDLKNEQEPNLFGHIPTEYMNNIRRTNDLINELTKSQQGFRESALEVVIPPIVSPPLDSFSKDMVQSFEDEFLKEPLEVGLSFPEVDELYKDFMKDFEESEKTRLNQEKESESARKVIMADTVNFQLQQLQDLETAFLLNNTHNLESEKFFAEERKAIYDKEAEETTERLQKEREERIQNGLDMANLIKSQAQDLLGFHEDNVNQRKDNAIKALKDSDEYERASSEKRKTMEKEVNKTFAEEEKRLFHMKQMSSLADIAMNTATSMSKHLGNPVMMGIITALGALQASAVMSQQPPVYEQGGLVGGNRHSQGGTMIEAERGEFVMSRNAVESIGAETLNQMNQSGNTGVTVNISAPLVDDTVVDRIIPAIQLALNEDRASLKI